MDSFSDTALQQLAEELGEVLRTHDRMLACAESCTGGWVSKICTDLPGSSRWFERGFVTYTNSAKQEMLCVPAETLAAHGAVSSDTVEAMARGALMRSHADLSLAISGIAGPGGAVEGKPVGTVFIAWGRCLDGQPQAEGLRFEFEGDREAVRRQAVAEALKGALDAARKW